jgi:hypothetical protein
MRFACFIFAASVLSIVVVARPAAADQQFFNAFIDEYIRSHPDKTYVEMVTKEAKCLVCHQGARSRKNRNVFGKEVDKLLDRKTDAKDREKIVAALKKSLDVRSDAKNDKSPTYLELVKAGKLPGGTLEEVKKEPAEPTAQ